MPPFKDEHVLIIAPGSHTTLAQLGLPESFTPAKWRFPTRMFPGEKPGEWEPHKIRNKTITTPAKDPTVSNGDLGQSQPDTEMKDASDTNGETAPSADVPSSQPLEEISTTIYEDDLLSIEGAVYPIREGHVENWPCLFALFSHIYNMLSPSFAYHSPVLVVSQPCWSARDHELLTQFFFENFKIPAFCIMDSALAACYAYGVTSATVVDVGHEKCDISTVSEYVVSNQGRGVGIQGCGGRGLTQRLLQALEKQGFNEEMAEQLKRNPICEILPIGAALPVSSQNGEQPINPAAAASTGAMDSGANAKDADGLRPGQAPRGPGFGTEVGEEGGIGDDDDNDGVLDVAAIVAKDNAAELLAKREREKAEKAALKKGGAFDANRQARLKNSEREKTSFTYEETLPYEETANGDGPVPSRKRKREIEVGVERFMAATPADGYTDGIIDTIAATIHNTILLQEPTQRSALWDNMIIVGNGSRIKGFTPALLSTLAARYTLSPSTATIFTSELPSNFSTPLPTNGTNTPVPGMMPHPTHHPAAHGVNPLLVAATRPTMPPSHHLQVQPHMTTEMHQMINHRSHSQTPTSIKTVKPPEYFPEWKDPSVSGMEEAGFLGAQVAAKVIFIVDQGLSKGFLTRVEYNEMGPAGIHECSM